MKKNKIKKLEKAGWKVGNYNDFLEEVIMDKKQFIDKLTACRKDYDSKQFKQDVQDLDNLINSSIGEYLQEKLNNYDVGSLEYKIIEEWIEEELL